MIERLFDRVLAGVKAAKFAYVSMRVRQRLRRTGPAGPDRQALELYSEAAFVDTVETWGQGTAWLEIGHLLVNCRGRVLDVACGTGISLVAWQRFDHCRLYGCDISEYLLRRAAKDAPPSRLAVCDATRTPYRDGAFDYSYSIGSLEHFTEPGIRRFIEEIRRVTRYASFHQVPTSRSGRDEGWIVLTQGYFNNSVAWWLDRFRVVYPTVHVLDSAWEDPISVGKWFVGMAG